MPGTSSRPSFDAATGEATLYHEPQVVYALDPEIAPVTKKLAGKLSYVPGAPTVIAGYCGGISRRRRWPRLRCLPAF